MSSKESQTSKTINYKIILIGDSLVGKTCFFRKLTKGTYSTKNISTIGMDQKTFSLNINVPSDPNDESSPEEEKEFLIHFWDTAGQERFRSITTGYFKQSHGLILLYDITNKTSFDNLEKWINAVTDTLGKNNKKYGLILLGNKVDLENKRKIQSEEAEEICKNNNIHWAGEVSVQEMTLDELNEKFEEFVKYIYSIVGKGEDDKKPIIRKLSTPKKSAKKKEKLCC